MLNILADAFQAAHEPSQQLSVDEAMVRSSMKQYMPKKPIKRGFKIFCLCDANGSYLQQFQIYTGTHYKIKSIMHVRIKLYLSCPYHSFCLRSTLCFCFTHTLRHRKRI